MGEVLLNINKTEEWGCGNGYHNLFFFPYIEKTLDFYMTGDSPLNRKIVLYKDF